MTTRHSGTARTFAAVTLAAALAAGTAPVAADTSQVPALRLALTRAVAADLAVARTAQLPPRPRRPPVLRASAKRRYLVGLGAIGGLVLGGYIGARIEGNGCLCDDPGLKGFVIGAPIGAFGGGILAWWLTR